MSAEAEGNFSGKHLVVFGAGYVGGEVARQARSRGLRVTALTRNRATAAELESSGIAVVVADVADHGWHRSIATRPDYVLNAVSSGGGGIEGYQRSYRDGLRSIHRWAEANPPAGRFIYTSSTSVYPQDGGASVDETAPVSARDERAGLLIDTEKIAGEIPGAVILRLAGIYGPGRSHLLEQVRSGVVSGCAEHHLNLIHRDDIVAAIWAVFGAPVAGTFNLVDDGPAPKSEVVAWLAERLGVPRPTFTGAPAGGRRAVTPNRIILNHRIKVALGWRPTFPTYREGYENLLSRR